MNSNKQKAVFGIPIWGLSLITAAISLVFLFLLAALLSLIPRISEDIGELIAYASYGILIATACFFICRHNPKSIWYVPILCNTMGIISAIVEPNFWISALWIVMCSGWILSIIGAVGGALFGKRTTQEII